MKIPFQFQEITCVHKNAQDLGNHLGHSNYLHVTNIQQRNSRLWTRLINTPTLNCTNLMLLLLVCYRCWIKDRWKILPMCTSIAAADLSVLGSLITKTFISFFSCKPRYCLSSRGDLGISVKIFFTPSIGSSIPTRGFHKKQNRWNKCGPKTPDFLGFRRTNLSISSRSFSVIVESLKKFIPTPRWLRFHVKIYRFFQITKSLSCFATVDVPPWCFWRFHFVRKWQREYGNKKKVEFAPLFS